jgi:hypothetical protein
MGGVNIDRQSMFIVQIGTDVHDKDKILAEEIVNALADYGFKDAQVLGRVR